MSTVEEPIEAQAIETSLAVIPPDASDLVVRRPPNVVLDEARKAATALHNVIESKKKKVTFNGETYLEYEDLMLLGRFYGVTAKVESTTTVEFEEIRGFESRAVALDASGREISAAEAMCLSDEPNWKAKPLFQLRSMAQTRACAKALRNVLAWVVVLAGYRPTPAEEMTGDAPPLAQPQRRSATEAAQKSAAPAPTSHEHGAPASNGPFAVRAVKMLKNGENASGPWELWGIDIGGPEKVTTFDTSIVAVAQEAMTKALPVYLDVEPGKNGKPQVKAISIAQPEDEDVPF